MVICYLIITVYLQLVIHGISKDDDDDECIASSKVYLVFHFCMYAVETNGVVCELF